MPDKKAKHVEPGAFVKHADSDAVGRVVEVYDDADGHAAAKVTWPSLATESVCKPSELTAVDPPKAKAARAEPKAEPETKP